MRELLWSLSLVMLIGGCSDPVATGAANGSQDAKPGEEPPATVFDPMVDTMDRAAAVDELSMSRKAEMDKAIEGAE